MSDATDRTAGADITDEHLAAQYEAYPYPQRDPRDEAKRLVIGSPSHLREIDHWVFGAARPRSTGLRALVAGGGTGDGAIMLAEQLRRDGRPGGVTYLDRSQAAQSVARARAAARGLSMQWESLSLLELPGSGLGPFDYIDCCGVLHHLPDPAAGVRALLSVLAPGGGLGLMVYAPHGRTGVYMLQEALGALAPEGEAPAVRLDVARRVMRHLPETAWLRANQYFGDHIDGGDAGLYDLLLNPRDRAYTVADLAGLLAGEGLAVTAWMEPMRYDPVAFLPDPKLRARVAGLDAIGQAGLAEALSGNMSTHVVYCVRAGGGADGAGPDAGRGGAGGAGDAGGGVGAGDPGGRDAAVRVRRAVGAGGAAEPGQGDPRADRWRAECGGIAGGGGGARGERGSRGQGLAGDVCGVGAGQSDPARCAGVRPVVVIFGAAVRPDGRPSGALRGRIEAALETGQGLVDPIYMPTGGQGRYGRPEADVMAEALIAAGVPDAAIWRERTAVNTMRSALACARLLTGSRARVYVATSTYHMVRCVLLLRLAGVRARSGRAPAGAASRSWRKRWLWRLREVPAVPIDAVLLVSARLWPRRSM